MVRLQTKLNLETALSPEETQSFLSVIGCELPPPKNVRGEFSAFFYRSAKILSLLLNGNPESRHRDKGCSSSWRASGESIIPGWAFHHGTATLGDSQCTCTLVLV